MIREKKMNDDYSVSIVIPVYNVIDYLSECVESCLNQTYENIEIVLVDDGSTDQSGEMCDVFASRNSKIKCIHKENGGLSDARNCGVMNCSCDFVMFVDSDDIICKDLVKELIESIIMYKADVAVCGIAHFISGQEPLFRDTNRISVLSSDDALIDFLYQKNISTSSCGKLYKRELVEKTPFVKGQRFEDNLFLYKVFSICSRVVCSDSQQYGYRHRDSSITTGSFSEVDFDIIGIGKEIIKKTKDKSVKIKKAVMAYQCANCLRIYLTATSDYTFDSRFVYSVKYLQKNSRYVLCDTSARKKERIALLMFMVRTPRKIMQRIRNKKSRWN